MDRDVAVFSNDQISGAGTKLYAISKTALLTTLLPSCPVSCCGTCMPTTELGCPAHQTRCSSPDGAGKGGWAVEDQSPLMGTKRRQHPGGLRARTAAEQSPVCELPRVSEQLFRDLRTGYLLHRGRDHIRCGEWAGLVQVATAPSLLRRARQRGDVVAGIPLMVVAPTARRGRLE